MQKAGFLTGLLLWPERWTTPFRYLGAMQPHTLTIPDEADYFQLLRVAEAAGLQIAADGTVSKKLVKPKRSREELLAIIAQGADVSNIPDPLAWQREQRSGRNLPFGQ